MYRPNQLLSCWENFASWLCPCRVCQKTVLPYDVLQKNWIVGGLKVKSIRSMQEA